MSWDPWRTARGHRCRAQVQAPSTMVLHGTQHDGGDPHAAPPVPSRAWAPRRPRCLGMGPDSPHHSRGPVPSCPRPPPAGPIPGDPHSPSSPPPASPVALCPVCPVRPVRPVCPVPAAPLGRAPFTLARPRLPPSGDARPGPARPRHTAQPGPGPPGAAGRDQTGTGAAAASRGIRRAPGRPRCPVLGARCPVPGPRCGSAPSRRPPQPGRPRYRQRQIGRAHV